jgi:hypothetical protein
MNLRETIRKQQENWGKRARHGGRHLEFECQFCVYMDQSGDSCCECPVIVVLRACGELDSVSAWDQAETKKDRADAARLVLADVNKIAKHYHYAVREV